MINDNKYLALNECFQNNFILVVLYIKNITLLKEP